MTSPLRREQMSVGLQVGLYEGATGTRLHGTIESLDRFAAYVWVSDKSFSTALPMRLRGYETRMTYEQAEAGGMWAEQPDQGQSAPRNANGHDLLAFWTKAHQAGLVGEHTASTYRAAVRRVLAAQPDGQDTEITHDPAEAIDRFTAANQTTLAPATLAQYASGYRRARKTYLDHHTNALDANRLEITLADGRSITVTTPGDLTDADRRRALTAVTSYLAPGPAPEPRPEHSAEADPGSAR